MRNFLVGIVLCALTLPVPAWAQQASTKYTVGPLLPFGSTNMFNTTTNTSMTRFTASAADTSHTKGVIGGTFPIWLVPAFTISYSVYHLKHNDTILVQYRTSPVKNVATTVWTSWVTAKTLVSADTLVGYANATGTLPMAGAAQFRVVFHDSTHAATVCSLDTRLWLQAP